MKVQYLRQNKNHLQKIEKKNQQNTQIINLASSSEIMPYLSKKFKTLTGKDRKALK